MRRVFSVYMVFPKESFSFPFLNQTLNFILYWGIAD